MKNSINVNQINKLIKNLEPTHYKLNEPMSKHTTVGIGGPADIWLETYSKEELINAIILARKLEIPITIIGRGSNILVSDNGIRGLVISNRSNKIEILQNTETKNKFKTSKITPRLTENQTIGTFKYSFSDLDYNETHLPTVDVYIESGVDMPFAINYLIDKGLTGLQWYSRIPGNLGGWIYNNTHGGTHFISELIKSVEVINKNNEIISIPREEIIFDYDKSRFQQTGEIILSAVLSLYKGDKNKAKIAVQEWAKRKSIQPMNSPGCVFKNISEDQKTKLKYPTTATGYIIEHILKLSGLKVGGASISKNHHNFIINENNATAKDFLEIIKIIKNKAKKEIGINLETEIFFIGFTQEELKEVELI